ncbi:MAG: hypothetical protein FWJ93_11150 [Micromonosporaceae bacterium]
MTFPPQDPYGRPDPYGQPGEPVPQYGYQVPGDFGSPQPAFAGPDPLVPPHGSGFSGWFEWVRATLARSWQSLGLILLTTVAVPQIVLAVFGFVAGQMLSVAMVPAELGGPAYGPETYIGITLVGLTLVVASLFAQVLGWAAGIWAVTQQAAGRRVTLPEALRAGLARVLPMFGWAVLTALMVMVGLILCIVPGLYFIVAASLFSFVVMYERGTGAIARSFSLVHSAFGPVLGRVALLVASYLIVNFLVSSGFGIAVTATSAVPGTAVSGLQLGGEVIRALIAVALDAVLLVGLLITYTEVRAAREPVSTPVLTAAVGP